MEVINKDQCREAFEAWLIQDRRSRISAMAEWTDEEIRGVVLHDSDREWAAWQAARSTPAAPVTYMPWDNFPSYLIDHCEGDTITEEGLQRALAAMLLDPQYSSADPAAPAELPERWREQFSRAVYTDLAAADNQDVPLEEYPNRILKVLDSIVGPRHPAVMQWRNDAIRACIEIVKRYGGGASAYQERDMAALYTAPAPVALPEPTYTLRVRGVFQDPAPTAQAFGLPDGEYNLYTGQQMRELLEKGGYQPAPNHLQTRMVAQFEAASKSSFEVATDRCLAGLVEQDRR